MTRRLPHPAWLALVLLAELPLLGHRPMVRDEVVSLEAGRRTLGALWDALHHIDAPVGLYYLLLHPWLDVSTSPTWTRLPSLLGMVAAVAVLTLTATRLGGRRAGALTALVLLANPATWAFATYVRPYSLALATAAVTLHVVLAAPRRAVLLGLAATLTVYLQGMFVLLLVAEGLLVLHRRQWRLAAALVVAGLLWLPLAVESAGQTVMTSWIPFTSPSSLATEVHDLFGSDGVVSAVGAVVWLALLVWALRGRQPRDVFLLGALPAAALVAAGFFLHVLGARYALYVVLTTSLALGLALAARERLPLAVPVVLALAAAGGLLHEATLDYRQEDLPAATAWLASHDQPGDLLLYDPDYSRTGLLPSLDATHGVDARDVAVLPVKDRRAVGALYLPEQTEPQVVQDLSGAARVWVVGYPDSTWRPTPDPEAQAVRTVLQDWTVTAEKRFGELDVRLLVRPAA